MMLQVEHLTFRFPGGGRCLSDISFTLARGEVICVLGPNGAGKTTLVRCLSGELPTQSGSVIIDNTPANKLTARQFASKVAHVPQATHSVFGHLVSDIVLMGRTAHLGIMETPGSRDREIAEASLARVGIAHLANQQLARISGGERQLCLLARALAQESPVLILDEPAASLDFGNQIRMLSIIAALAHRGYAILMITHHPDHALQIGTHVICLREGRIFGSGNPKTLLSSPFLSELYDAPIRVLEETDGTRACVPVLTPEKRESL